MFEMHNVFIFSTVLLFVRCTEATYSDDVLLKAAFSGFEQRLRFDCSENFDSHVALQMKIHSSIMPVGLNDALVSLYVLIEIVYLHKFFAQLLRLVEFVSAD